MAGELLLLFTEVLKYSPLSVTDLIISELSHQVRMREWE